MSNDQINRLYSLLVWVLIAVLVTGALALIILIVLLQIKGSLTITVQ
jgi:hypothetical protein